jgi:hypothetical protein
MSIDKTLWLQGALYVIPAAGAPVLAVLTASSPITSRTIAGMIVGAIIGGCVALKAFLSTTYAASPTSNFEKQAPSHNLQSEI